MRGRILGAALMLIVCQLLTGCWCCRPFWFRRCYDPCYGGGCYSGVGYYQGAYTAGPEAGACCGYGPAAELDAPNGIPGPAPFPGIVPPVDQRPYMPMSPPLTKR